MSNMKTWVISLDSAHQRRAHIIAQQHALGLPEVTWFNAVDGLTLPHEATLGAVQEARLQRRAGRGFSLGELGCALSHRGVWQEFLSGDEQYVLVLEDDAVLSPELPAMLPDFRRYLSCEQPKVIVLGAVRLFADQASQPLTDKFSLIVPLRCWGGYAYLINRAAALRLIDFQTPLRCMADDWWLYQKSGGVQVRGLQPYLASVLHFGDSHLEEQRSILRAYKPLRWLHLVRLCDRIAHKCYESFQALVSGPLRTSEPCTNPHAENISKKKYGR